MLAEKFRARHFLAIQQAIKIQELGNAYWIPGRENPADGLTTLRSEILAAPPRGGFSGALIQFYLLPARFVLRDLPLAIYAIACGVLCFLLLVGSGDVQQLFWKWILKHPPVFWGKSRRRCEPARLRLNYGAALAPRFKHHFPQGPIQLTWPYRTQRNTSRSFWGSRSALRLPMRADRFLRLPLVSITRIWRGIAWRRSSRRTRWIKIGCIRRVRRRLRISSRAPSP